MLRLVMCIFSLCYFFVVKCSVFCVFFFFKQKTAYEMRISDWSSDVCSSDLFGGRTGRRGACRLASLGLRRQLLEEISDRHPQHPGEVEEAAREDAVGAALVLLDLLKGDAERAPGFPG